MRFTFGVGTPGRGTGTLDQLLAVVGGRLRNAAEALEAPNEFDQFVGGRALGRRACRATARDLYRKVEGATRRSAGCRSSARRSARRPAPSRVGNQRTCLDVGNIHPYTGGLSPDPRHIARRARRGSGVSGRKPVWATEAGFHNAMRGARAASSPPSPRRPAPSTCCARSSSTSTSGIRRTYAYELLDEKPDRARARPRAALRPAAQRLLPKPAFKALKNLLALSARATERRPRLRPLRLDVLGPADLRRLVLPEGRRHLPRRALAHRQRLGPRASAACAWHRGPSP